MEDEPEVQGHPQLPSVFEASLGYMRPSVGGEGEYIHVYIYKSEPQVWLSSSGEK